MGSNDLSAQGIMLEMNRLYQICMALETRCEIGDWVTTQIRN
jgi:hypothetical protein